MTELKPCPFCGGQAHRMFGPEVWIECTECQASSCMHCNIETAEDDWNRRDEDCELRGKLMAAHSKIMCLESQIEKLRQRLDRRGNE